MAFVQGSTAYIVESNLHVRRVVILKVNGGLYTVQFDGGKGATCVRKSRLFVTEEEAQASIHKHKRQPSRHPWG